MYCLMGKQAATMARRWERDLTWPTAFAWRRMLPIEVASMGPVMTGRLIALAAN